MVFSGEIFILMEDMAKSPAGFEITNLFVPYQILSSLSCIIN